jgi:hypothetical protein
MGALESKPIEEFTKENISHAVVKLGEPYQVYIEVVTRIWTQYYHFT